MILIEQIDKQIDVHAKFMDSMEQIRWRFTSAFGITAVISTLFLGSKIGDDLPSTKMFIAFGIVAAMALAGLITQVRIIGLFWSEWNRIRILQLEKIKLLEEKNIEINENIKKTWSLPYFVPPKSDKKLYVTVHESNCFLFSVIFSSDIGLMVNTFFNNQIALVSIVVFGTFFSTYITHKLGRHYCDIVFEHG